MDKESLPKGCRIMFIVKDGKEHYLRTMTDETGQPPATAEAFLKGVENLYSQVVWEGMEEPADVRSGIRKLQETMGYEPEDAEEFEAIMIQSVIPHMIPLAFRETVKEWYKSHSPKELTEDEWWELYLPDLMCMATRDDLPTEWEPLQEE